MNCNERRGVAYSMESSLPYSHSLTVSFLFLYFLFSLYRFKCKAHVRLRFSLDELIFLLKFVMGWVFLCTPERRENIVHMFVVIIHDRFIHFHKRFSLVEHICKNILWSRSRKITRVASDCIMFWSRPRDVFSKHRWGSIMIWDAFC